MKRAAESAYCDGPLRVTAGRAAASDSGSGPQAVANEVGR